MAPREYYCIHPGALPEAPWKTLYVRARGFDFFNSIQFSFLLHSEAKMRSSPIFVSFAGLALTSQAASIAAREADACGQITEKALKHEQQGLSELFCSSI